MYRRITVKRNVTSIKITINQSKRNTITNIDKNKYTKPKKNTKYPFNFALFMKLTTNTNLINPTIPS